MRTLGYRIFISCLLLSLSFGAGSGCTPMGKMQEQSYHGSIPGVKALLVDGVDVNEDSEGHGTPLVIAAEQGQVEMVEFLLANGADPHLGNCLQVAVRYNVSSEIAKLLLMHGALVNGQDPQGMTPLHTAALYGRVATVRFLLDSGADKKIKDKSGRIAEVYGREQGYGAIIDMLTSY